MKEDIKDLWVAALRSGKYKQGKTCLKKNDAFCCLGVLCDISGQGEWKPETSFFNQEYLCDSFISFDNDKSINASTSCLPKNILKYSGIRTFLGSFFSKSDEKLIYLSDLNDINNYSFKQIADVIEKYWEEL